MWLNLKYLCILTYIPKRGIYGVIVVEVHIPFGDIRSYLYVQTNVKERHIGSMDGSYPVPRYAQTGGTCALHKLGIFWTLRQVYTIDLID